MKESESQLAPQFFRVVARREEAKDTFTIELAHPDGRELHLAPGQFNILYSFGVEEVPISPIPLSTWAIRSNSRALQALFTSSISAR